MTADLERPVSGNRPAPAASPARPRRSALERLLTPLLVLGIVVLLVVSGSTGPLQTTFLESLQIMAGHLIPGLPWMSDGSLTVSQDQAVWSFRLPRALLAGIAGSSLALAGALLQANVRNPLAEPYILGVSAGAGVGAVLAIVAGSTAVGGLGLNASAFAGAAAATALVYLLAKQDGVIAPSRLILAGVALGSLLSAITNFLTITTDAQNVYSVLFFLLGSVSAATYPQLLPPGVALVAISVFAMFRSRALNAFLAGDETATALGVNVESLRRTLLLATALLTATTVAVCGGIGFVGLVVPHAARMLVGSDHRRMLPVTIFGGALFLILTDLLARTVAQPAEIPLGILTATVGAPFFLWLMRGNGAVRGGIKR
ncbi:iron complex transport system permease protein [Paenarthrobacter nicotinovorans]|uniref:Iron complex transport system permease protein n=1 Tax=Paenarthrobacter nicotinovorans TaxID=29320 RepID=A0ABT9TM46_PAENI|nr:iron ABC transporter permease [Paenarthrobacter nicotinovorans]MDQ0102726.1 iron complex transport system permease protein [Paenarthrobacter nicotinovorans]